MTLNEELRNANKLLLSQLKKSQEEISQLIVAAKHSDPRVLSFQASNKPPLTSTVCNRSQIQSFHPSTRSTFNTKKSLHKSPGILKRKSISTKLRLSSPNAVTSGNTPSKYHVISKFLQQKHDEGHDLTFSHTPNDQPLLTAAGNSRPIKRNAKTTPLKTSLAHPNPDKPLQVTFMTPDNKYHSDNAEAGRRTPPLLGYDWIAGVVDNSDVVTPKHSNSFLEEMKEFRKLNRSECHSKKYWEEMLRTPKTPIEVLSPYRRIKTTQKSPDPSDTRDPRIINYTINKRLFPVPVDPNEEVCPGSTTSPRYIRVSIPKSSLISPYRYKALHKGNFSEGADTLSLPDHCVMGWQNTVPKRPEQNHHSTGLDLRSSMRPKESLVGLQLKSGQLSMPVRQNVLEESILDESYALQYKLLQSRNRR